MARVRHAPHGTRRRAAQAPRVPALDGLRAIAVIAVLLFHGGLLPGGFLGVSAFFTLSGFLICGLLLSELSSTGRINVVRFWARRARRLLPAALAAVALVVAFVVFAGSPDQRVSLRGDVLAALGYVANWRFVAAGRDYGQLFADPSPVQHFWSLAIEEQFYLLFPLVLVGVGALAGRRARPTTVRVAVGAIAAVGAVASLVAAAVVSPIHAYYGTDTRACELLIGALAACALGTPAGGMRGSVLVPTCRKLAPVALATVGFWWWTMHDQDPFVLHGGLILHALLTAVVVVGLSAGGWLARALSWRPLVRLGAISYGLYLYHWPIFLWLDARRTHLSGWALFALRVTVSIAVAAMSARRLERPVMAQRSWTPAQLRLGVPVTVTALVAVASVVAMVAPEPAVSLTAPAAPPLPSSSRPLTTELAATVSQTLPEPTVAPADSAAPGSALGVGGEPASATEGATATSAAGPTAARGAGPANGPAASRTTAGRTGVSAPGDRQPASTQERSPTTSVPATLSTVAAAVAAFSAGERAVGPLAPTGDPLVRAARRRAVVPAGEVPRILVVGDSVALTLGDGVARWAKDTGLAQVWDAGSLGCGIARGGVHRYVNHSPESMPEICEQWSTIRAQQVADIRPHLVVVMSGTWDVTDRRLAGSSTWTHIGDADMDRYFKSELDGFFDVVGASGTTIVWLDHPAIKAGIKEGLAGPFPESDPERMARLNELAAEVAATRTDTALIDVAGYLRAQPGGEIDLTRRPDGIHWSRDAGRQDAEWLGPALLSLLDRTGT